ncbi:hypothetical protein [Streptomyces candidus]|uniref:Uncharacterized protein n=1 Tax=Streptomyces candidus TaxID=67283 RepID=A0A7X0HMG8_9ACTN|nr:hypothetical protein [Streptomyces candidus]MBB6439099.1 hypothetical protein [Streptomyces candidus]GHH55636.1 hypothetical protein GCM10018773_60400 [Streptomyces candidus]
MRRTEQYEVDVPIHTYDRALHGVHVFTGRATSVTEAVQRAHEAVDAAFAARQAGREIPGQQDGGWGARGVRDGWELDWAAAKAGPWSNPFSWTRKELYEL